MHHADLFVVPSYCWQHLADCALHEHLSHKTEALSVGVKIAEGLDDGLMFLEAENYFSRATRPGTSYTRG